MRRPGWGRGHSRDLDLFPGLPGHQPRENNSIRVFRKKTPGKKTIAPKPCPPLTAFSHFRYPPPKPHPQAPPPTHHAAPPLLQKHIAPSPRRAFFLKLVPKPRLDHGKARASPRRSQIIAGRDKQFERPTPIVRNGIPCKPNQCLPPWPHPNQTGPASPA